MIMAAGCKGRHHETGGQSVSVINVGQLKNLISVQTNNVVFLHFWATWCPPCVEEFPDMIKLADKWDGQGVTVLFVSADRPQEIAAVNDYLVKHHVRHSCYLADNLNDDFITGVSPHWSGALPASFFIAPGGTIVEWWEGSRSYATYELGIQNVLNRNKEGKP
jgi:thiol-disulfide isomerase/thioredoxin